MRKLLIWTKSKGKISKLAKQLVMTIKKNYSRNSPNLKIQPLSNSSKKKKISKLRWKLLMKTTNNWLWFLKNQLSLWVRWRITSITSNSYQRIKLMKLRRTNLGKFEKTLFLPEIEIQAHTPRKKMRYFSKKTKALKIEVKMKVKSHKWVPTQTIETVCKAWWHLIHNSELKVWWKETIAILILQTIWTLLILIS